MYSSFSYYAVLANLLYTFNMVNYPELSAPKNRLYAVHNDKTQTEASADKEYYHGLMNTKVEFELINLFSSNTNQLPQVFLFYLPLNKIAQVLLWTIAVYFVSIQGIKI